MHDCHIGGSQKQQRWKVPEDFPDELLTDVKEDVQMKDRSKKRYVIDLCAGDGSLGPVVLDHGFIYVPVDLRNGCNDDEDEKIRVKR